VLFLAVESDQVEWYCFIQTVVYEHLFEDHTDGFLEGYICVQRYDIIGYH